MFDQERRLYYFVSDVHLGLRAFDPVQREKQFARFLHELPAQTTRLYLLGDIFDFWYEYKYVIPRRFTRTLGALAHLADRGVELYFLRGNHDVWTYDYLQQEIGVTVLDEMSVVNIEGKRICLAHGDELSGERAHLFLKGLFKNRLLQRLFSMIHPRWAFAVATRWSKHNRLARGEKLLFRGQNDPLFGVAAKFETENHVDEFIFGHMHTPGNTLTPKGAGFYILGEWIHGCEYLVFDSITGVLEWAKPDFTEAN
ncbi:MAG: UDP-2,3-diacylglucosamine diphosphatase [Rikenellaceae bacterium]|jgi:UDP-2,3-diacylglucosamine hydrolase|nr:UDP-2,3-diacylglucosamine diphosphatase [Rikenellaceae bacterium]